MFILLLFISIYAVNAGNCPSVSFRKVDSWPGAFNGEVNITAGNTLLQNWGLKFTMASTISNIWNAIQVSRTGDLYDIVGPNWKKSIDANSLYSFGFTASGSADATGFVVYSNGQIVNCGTATTAAPTTTRTTTSTAAPTTTRTTTTTAAPTTTRTTLRTTTTSAAPTTTRTTTTTAAPTTTRTTTTTAAPTTTTTVAPTTTRTTTTTTTAPTTTRTTTTTTAAPTTTTSTTRTTTTTTAAPTTSTTASISTTAASNACDPLVVETTIVSDWGTGFTGNIKVTNIGSNTVNSWKVKAFFVGTITTFWGSSLDSSANGQAIFSGPSWAINLAPGAVQVVGFNVDGSASSFLLSATQAANNGGNFAQCSNNVVLTTVNNSPTTTQQQQQQTTTQSTRITTISAQTTAPATSSGNAPIRTSNVGNSLTRFNEWLNKLTTMEQQGTVRAVHSSGGAAGGVVSEGQGYGLLMAGILAGSLNPSSAEFQHVISRGYELYLGWKRMCILSSSNSCQNKLCGLNNNEYVCLPHWKFWDDLSGAQGTGSALDGDEDAMLGLILLVKATQTMQSSYLWWNEMNNNAYQTCLAFLNYDVVQDGSGMIKLGSCWGGWDCTNPSYIAPAHYRACRDFMQERSNTYTAQWNTVIDTSNTILAAAQCDTTGLVPNWYVPNRNNPSLQGTTSCSGSGTPAAEYGSEASRTVWRVALDYLWYRTVQSEAFLQLVSSQIIAKNPSGQIWNNLDTGCLVTQIFNDWSNNAFIYGPTFTALIKPTSNINAQLSTINNAAQKIASYVINDYFAGSWAVLSTMTLNGDLETASRVLQGSTRIATTVRAAVYYQMTSVAFISATTADQMILNNLQDKDTKNYDIILSFHSAQSGGSLSSTGAAGSFSTFTNQPAAALQFMNTLKAANRRVLLAIGGAKGYSTGWEFVKTTQEINAFVNSVKNFVDSFGFNGVDVDFEELESVAQNSAEWNALQQQRINILKALRNVLPLSNYHLSVAIWSIGGCTSSLCPSFVGNNNLGMDLPIFQDVALTASLDSFHVMSYFTGLENNPVAQITNTVAAVAAQNVPKYKIHGGIMAGGQYTVTSATNYCDALRNAGYQTFLWDLNGSTATLVPTLF